MIELTGLTPPGNAEVGVAGDVLNTAIYLSRALPQPHTVSFVSCLGTDALSDRMESYICAEGINTSHWVRIPPAHPVFMQSTPIVGGSAHPFIDGISRRRGFYFGHLMVRASICSTSLIWCILRALRLQFYRMIFAQHSWSGWIIFVARMSARACTCCCTLERVCQTLRKTRGCFKSD